MNNRTETTAKPEATFSVTLSDLRGLFGVCMPLLDERQRRIFAASVAKMLSHGGKKVVSELTSLSYPTLAKGAKEVEELEFDPQARPSIKDGQRVRKEGGGRKSITERCPGIDEAIEALLDGHVVGNPESPLCWTTKSTYVLQKLLEKQGLKISPDTIANRLKAMNFSLQQNRKYLEKGANSPDRDAQFRFISDLCQSFFAEGMPVISVDAKKKELVGNYKNAGREYRRVGDPRKTNGHDFEGPEGKATPYGIYDIYANEGFVNVGISADTAEFAAFSIKRWWETMGKSRYPNATKLLITADCGGSNSARTRLWKVQLQKLATELQLDIHVCHFPPGTSKWNKIEHRLFAQISRTWRGQPLESLAVIVSLIAATTTDKGLSVHCELDENAYERGIKVSDKEMASLNLERSAWRGDWNYVMHPQSAPT